MNILTDYIVNEQTQALLPAKQIEYETIVLENGKQFFVKQPAFQLMKEACLQYGSSYDGRREAVKHRTSFTRKVPIPISIHKNIYAFPTHAPSDDECIWIFYNHVHHTSCIPANENREQKSIICFKDQMRLPLSISHYTLKKQLERTAICQYTFSDQLPIYY